MQIVHVIDNLGMGGGQAMMFELYRAIKKYYPNYEQSVISLERRYMNEKFISTYDIPYNCMSMNAFPERISAQTKPTVLFFHKLMGSKTEIYNKIMKKGKIPVIVINHTFSKSPRYNKIEKCDIVVSVCNNMKKYLKSFNKNLKHIVIYNSVSQEDHGLVKSVFSNQSEYLITGRINMFNRIKYSDNWLHWCSEVKLPKIMVHEYIGDGFYLSRARNYVKKLNATGRNKINIIGKIENYKKRYALVRRWDLFLYEINQDEGLSMSILESLSSGVPVICSDHYGNKEIIKEGINGYVFKNRNEAKNILKYLCKNPDKLENLKKTTAEHFKNNLDIKYTVKQYIDLVNRVYKNKIGIEKESKIKKNIKIKKQENKEKIEGNNMKTLFVGKKEISFEIRENKTMKKNENTSNKFVILSGVYNSGKYFKDWAKSIKKQTYRPIDIIIVDDQSNDETPKIISDLFDFFDKTDIGFKCISPTEKLYCGSSYNLALQNVDTGEYFGILDSDDVLEPFACQEVSSLYEKYKEVDFIYTQFLWCRENLEKIRTGFNCAPREGESLLSLAEKRVHGFGHWRTFHKRFSKPHKLFKCGLKCSVDKYMGYRLEDFGQGMFFDKICYKYRSGTFNSVSATKVAVEVWQEVIKEIKARRKLYGYIPKPIMKV